MRILWSAIDDPQDWSIVTSDASEGGWCVYDSDQNFLAGTYNGAESIATLEARAFNNYLQWAGNSGVGYLWMGDNTNCVYSYRKAYSGSSALAGELRNFAKLAERNALSVVTKYINTHRNLIADMGTRDQVFMASVYHDIFSSKHSSL